MVLILQFSYEILTISETRMIYFHSEEFQNQQTRLVFSLIVLLFSFSGKSSAISVKQNFPWKSKRNGKLQHVISGVAADKDAERHESSDL